MQIRLSGGMERSRDWRRIQTYMMVEGSKWPALDGWTVTFHPRAMRESGHLGSHFENGDGDLVFRFNDGLREGEMGVPPDFEVSDCRGDACMLMELLNEAIQPDMGDGYDLQ